MKYVSRPSRQSLYTKCIALTAIVALSLSSTNTAFAISTLVTNGLEKIGNFPTGFDGIQNTSWRVDTATEDHATVTAIDPDFGGESDATLSDDTDWTLVLEDDCDDCNKEIVFPDNFTVPFNGTEYDSVFVGSNTYFTFGNGSNQYTDLDASTPALPGVQICAEDNSYQMIYSRMDDANTLRIRYEGTDSTGGDIGSPTKVIEIVLYNDETYFDVHVGRQDGCDFTTGSPYIPSASYVGVPVSVDIGTWQDSETPTFTYQWYNNDGDEWGAIDGATESLYTPTEDDVPRLPLKCTTGVRRS